MAENLDDGVVAPTTTAPAASSSRRARYSSALFAVGALVCPACGGKRKIIAVLTTPDAIRGSYNRSARVCLLAVRLYLRRATSAALVSSHVAKSSSCRRATVLTSAAIEALSSVDDLALDGVAE